MSVKIITRSVALAVASTLVLAGFLGFSTATAPTAEAAQSYTKYTNSTSSIGGIGVQYANRTRTGTLARGASTQGSTTYSEPAAVLIRPGYRIAVKSPGRTTTYIDGNRYSGPTWVNLTQNYDYTLVLS